MNLGDQKFSRLGEAEYKAIDDSQVVQATDLAWPLYFTQICKQHFPRAEIPLWPIVLIARVVFAYHAHHSKNHYKCEIKIENNKKFWR